MNMTINISFVLLLLLMTLFGAAGGALFKYSSAKKKRFYLFAGLFCYGAGSLINIYLLGKWPYTTVLPANSLTFIWTLGFARIFFKEKISIRKVLGICCIAGGMSLLIL